MRSTIQSFAVALVMLVPLAHYGQSLTWKGSQSTDFYNELNWVVSGSATNPAAGSLDPGTAIAYDLTISGAKLDISGNSLLFTASGKGITLKGAELTLDGLTVGMIKVSDTSTLVLKSSTPLGDQASLDLADNHSWIKMTTVNGYRADSVYMSKITSNGASLTLGTNVRRTQYYRGSLIRLLDANFKPLTLFDDKGQAGESFSIPEFTIYARNQLGAFDNRTSSFRLERGYQVSMAIFQNGTGKSQVFIANEAPLEIDLSQALDNNISFIRVMPWIWVNKKGVGGNITDMDQSWFYNWGNGSTSSPVTEYALMAWGGESATAAAVARHITKTNITHIMGFNESDNCNDQSGQYGGLCQIDVAVPLFKNLMGTGLRLVSPSPRENGPFTWLKSFRDEARKVDVRYDVLGVHWYDWGGNPTSTPFEDPVKIFNRFKTYLTNVYNEHKMPIWITEFNANANRDVSVQKAFLELALPYLESLEYVERYAYFQPMESVANDRTDIQFAKYFDQNGNITDFGIFYRDFESTPSVPEATWSTPSYLTDLDKKIRISFELPKDTLREGEGMVLKATTDRAVGAPQTFKFQLSINDDQFTIRDVELTIPEGGTTAETTLAIVNDDLVEDTVEVFVGLVPTSDGIDWLNTEGSFVMVSEDQVVETPLSLSVRNELKTWPNPAANLLHVEDQPAGVSSIKLFSIDGKVIELNPDVTGVYEVSHLTSGLYILKVKAQDQRVWSSKVVIE